MSTQAASPNSSSLVHTPHSSHLGTQRKQPLHLRVTKLARENMTRSQKNTLMFWLQRNLNKTSIKQGNQVLTYIYIFTSFTIYWLSHPHTLHRNLKSPGQVMLLLVQSINTQDYIEINASDRSYLNPLSEFPVTELPPNPVQWAYDHLSKLRITYCGNNTT
ncbi:hypothetical protein H5410_020245 [Solanum commersonii]|uniref:Uncharacterized protein n=1 Tax=Solanum commersonii TaxID=4109 RepID=A0A9J5ZBW7_SOLCO|nr:hypothetical protein H5410_020245 [Solanum commersonii]